MRKLDIIKLSTIAAGLSVLGTFLPANAASLGTITIGGNSNLFELGSNDTLEFSDAEVITTTGEFASIRTGTDVIVNEIKISGLPVNNPVVTTQGSPALVSFTAAETDPVTIVEDRLPNFYGIQYQGTWDINNKVYPGFLALSSESTSPGKLEASAFSISGRIDPLAPPQQIPEPMTILGSAFVLGVGSYFKSKQNKKK